MNDDLIKKAADEYAIDTNAKRLETYPEAMRPFLSPEYVMDDLAVAFEAGVKFVLAKKREDGLREQNRLHIAAMIEPALITNPDLWKRCGNYYAGPGRDSAHSFAELALEYADALIAVEKKKEAGR